LKHLGVESEAFYAESTGTIALADVTTNSTLNLPLDLSLRRALAEKTGLAAADGSTNKYAKLTRFVSVKGTLGSPDVDINKLAVAGMMLKGAEAFGLGNAKTQGALGAVGNLLTGQGGGTNNTSTNATANIVGAVGSLLGGKTASTNTVNTATNNTKNDLARGLSGLLTQPATNATRTATNAAPTNTVERALDSLLQPKPKPKKK
jgi:hypothetical protein